MSLSRQELTDRIIENAGESCWDIEELLLQALTFMDDDAILKYYTKCHSSYWNDEED